MTEDTFVKELGKLAATLVPYVDVPTIEEQDRRWKEPPFVWYRFALLAQALLNEKNEKIASLRHELIEVRKELSRLKRNKE